MMKIYIYYSLLCKGSLHAALLYFIYLSVVVFLMVEDAGTACLEALRYNRFGSLFQPEPKLLIERDLKHFGRMHYCASR
jgi:hypothetical protein